jgi:hypothetical protein
MPGDIGRVDPAVAAAVPAHTAVQVQNRHVPAEPVQQAGHRQAEFRLVPESRRLAPVRQPAVPADPMIADAVVVRRGIDQSLARADTQGLQQAAVCGCRRVQVSRRVREQLIERLADHLDDPVEMTHSLRIPLVKYAGRAHHLSRRPEILELDTGDQQILDLPERFHLLKELAELSLERLT